jgi:GNAT superfamily N-acetyltransferase
MKRLIKSSTAANLTIGTDSLGDSIISVTQNYASISDFEHFLELKEHNIIPVNMKENAYELWINKELVGYCIFYFEIETLDEHIKLLEFDDDEYDSFEKDNKKTLFLETNLDIVYIVEKYQGIGLGVFFAQTINEILNSNILAYVNFSEKNKFNKIEINAHAEYESKGGEMVHCIIHSDCDGFLKHVLKHELSVDVQFEYDACY